MYLFLFITLYMFQAHRAHREEREILSVQPLVTVIFVGGRDVCRMEEHAHISATNIERLLPGCVDTICLS